MTDKQNGNTAPVNRAGKRRRDRETTKGDRMVNGVSHRQLKEAEDMLTASAADQNVDAEVTFAVHLDDWKTAEHSREELRASHIQAIRKKRAGRQVEPEKVVELFAQAIIDLDDIEADMIAFLETLRFDEGKIDQLLQGRHVIPTKGVIYTVPDVFQERLIEALYPQEEEEPAKS
jgi:hypothetical protein